jgi:hypothetical protein
VKCLGITGWLFGHAFHPRHTIEEHSTGYRPDEFRDGTVKIKGDMPTRTYSKLHYGDVCERCGETRNQGEPA